ncbi:12136_t:CDS:2 [Ambispora leptoticha]|uniref:12136_t:CDS:1 n=1 Tax=Ambispora leptoticha TaxID=144679 RepID=A0A9N9F504_9GLOM|nr:12136_t:CDS:2 [Ambispora leptoticha]
MTILWYRLPNSSPSPLKQRINQLNADELRPNCCVPKLLFRFWTGDTNVHSNRAFFTG